MDFLRIWRVQSCIFTGYAWNSIPDLALLDKKKNGVNINIGSGVKLNLTEAISLGYQANYKFSISENIPFNFRHQFGVHLIPKQFKFCDKSNSKIKLEDDLFAYWLDSLNSVHDSFLNSVPDSLLYALTHANNAKVEYIQTQDIKVLEKYIHLLKKGNQRLLEEVRSKMNFQDSDFSTFSFIDSAGMILSLTSGELTSGNCLYRS